MVDTSIQSPSEAGTAWMEAAFERLRSAGYRSGGARTAVVELLAREGGCMEAEHVSEALRSEGRSVGTASVYRALSVLTDLGLLQRIAVPGAPIRYELVLPDGEHHHHIVCDRCGKTVAFDDEELEAAVEAISRRASFRVEGHDVTLHGVCETCEAE